MTSVSPDSSAVPQAAAAPAQRAAAAPGLPVAHHSPAPDAAWRALLQAACAPYRMQGRFAYHFAQGKLGRDPVFRCLLERGDIPPRARVLDIGCGQGLLASLLAAVDQAQADGHWPVAWQAAPVACRYTGIELMPRDVARAQGALGSLPTPPRFVCANMVDPALELPPSEVVVILDVLHYVDLPAQLALLTRVRDALLPHGRLLLRIGDQADRRGFATSQWVDRVVTMVRGHRVAPTFCRPLAEWVALLEGLGFTVHSLPMSRGTPFANVLLAADL